MAGGGGETVQCGKRGGLTVAQIRENHAVAFFAGVRGVFDQCVRVGTGGLCRLLKAVTLAVEQPAVEGTAQAICFESAVRQVDTAMGAETPGEPVFAVGGLEQYQLLVHQGDRFYGAFAVEFFGERHGLPVAAQYLTGSGFGAGFGKADILFGSQHVINPNISLKYEQRRV